MTTKEYLLQVTLLDKKIDANLEMLAIEKSKLTRVTSKLDENKVQSSEGVNFDDTLASVMDLETKITKEIDAYINLKAKISSEINSMKDNTLALILFKRYVLNKTLVEIAKELNYSYDHVRHLHGQALMEFRRR
jgi:DNA-directed RNA polymerase specialized sigma subunit|nr:MAG TPA: Protein of unknown function (DUF1492) [Caudoviricetes sp.]